MGALREVLIEFSVLVDDKPLSRVDKRLNILKDKVVTFSKYAVAGFAAAGFAAYKFIDAASSVNEMQNVINRTFADPKAVMKWSATISKELGRSRYDLQDYASRFGAFLEPQFRGTEQDITKMSERLSGLAVDLASFYNTSDEEAIMRLFSGLSGETEAVRRLGIDISDTSLEDYNRRVKGDNRTMRSLTLQEKTLLRFDKILNDTEKKQGDAAMTAGGWANSLKRVEGKLRDIKVAIGQKLMPIALEMLKTIEKWVDGSEGLWHNLTKTHKTLQTIGQLMTAGTVLYGAIKVGGWVETIFKSWEKIRMAMLRVGWATGLIATTGFQFNRQLAFAAGKLALMAAAAYGVFLVLEDINTGFALGNSFARSWVTWTAGVRDTAEGAKIAFEAWGIALHNAWEWVKQIVDLLPSIGRSIGGMLYDNSPGQHGNERSGIRATFADPANEGDYIDLGQVQQQRESTAQGMYQDAVKSGNVLEAAKQLHFLSQGALTRQDAVARAREEISSARGVNRGRAPAAAPYMPGQGPLVMPGGAGSGVTLQIEKIEVHASTAEGGEKAAAAFHQRMLREAKRKKH